MSTNTQRAVLRIKDQLREGSRLGKMHTTDGRKWFLLPRNRKALCKEVADHIAELVIKEVDVFPGSDGLWPGCDQTWGVGDENEGSERSRPQAVGDTSKQGG